MKIYFAGSIRGGRKHQAIYQQLIAYLSKYGKVLSEHIGSKNLTQFGEKSFSDKRIYNRDMSWLKVSDVVIAEVSTPSLGVGYEIAKAENMNKKILCLYRKQPRKRLSAMINGNPNVKIAEYKTFKDALRYIDIFFKELK
ncbi:MAG: deoxyribonucleoside 5'-monophosphate N-glycosidase [Candidatus Parcubacteria bacterium]|nr:MAG: deoxyribonucleoside 5'-monophosphate N-glycosidase [Candidatus Parcubacteria bacterium]